MRRSTLAVAAVLATGAAVGGVVLWRHGGVPLAAANGCVARVGNNPAVHLGLDQAHNAALIAAVGVRRDLPPRATSIALAAAYQESKIRNLSYGDRDSVGLFQQRPSQGWGSRQQILDPYYATGAFYDALQRVAGYESMPIAEASQAVQRSADGSAYQQHEQSARMLASALTGYSRAAFSCTVTAPSEPGSAAAVTRDVRRAFGPVSSDTAADKSVDFRATGPRRGWALAQYLVANADRLRLRSVGFAGWVWTAERSSDGWRKDTGTAAYVRVVIG